MIDSRCIDILHLRSPVPEKVLGEAKKDLAHDLERRGMRPISKIESGTVFNPIKRWFITTVYVEEVSVLGD